MSRSKIKVVRIEESQQQASLSPAQRKFNGLIHKINAQKKLLVTWQETIPQFQQEIARKLLPLRDIFCEHQAEIVVMLDTLYTTQKFTHEQQDKIAYLISSICEELISQHGREDLKSLHDYYSGQNYDDVALERNEIASELLKSMFEQEFGVELDDEEFDFSDPEGTSARLVEKMQEQQAQESRRKRKKSAKKLAEEARKQEEEANISKSIQAVYRQLVGALHPDREPDPVERERKTGLIQRVTVAYGKKDLLQLLELQLSVKQIDQNKINNIADDLLKHYNKILQSQLEELQQEVMQTEQSIRKMIALAPYERLSPKRLFALLHEDIHRLQNQISRIQHDLMLFNDVKQFKLWLKGYRIPESEFNPFF
ncbi:molecular chaperone DnaJ [Nitrosomonas sp. Nm166]|uniref:molecular chaperone DnaJ n=1 Tax=Nitrosomonas sp. Nm166 TaxID=1881054 RepID=UPI0008EA520A|nr:molecular chaperone DnaJ [Nitrosomonas sp. Nm166]SFD84463.1 hypothetical protein SAMN05428977_100121 [Nitrosomonas sp. Nm166]